MYHTQIGCIITDITLVFILLRRGNYHAVFSDHKSHKLNDSSFETSWAFGFVEHREDKKMMSPFYSLEALSCRSPANPSLV